ncbi:hypothetical protein NDU88_006447 [Pleurodeles waltl]|uniref:Uncharacterized protein n=1 Tax=Pleurodeles waltl TaxID=8319 RepID=A0AAV7PRD0_PLEWA|nr:hypothetical protein NDU88_006447 [Pleurodeles waltl]
MRRHLDLALSGDRAVACAAAHRSMLEMPSVKPSIKPSSKPVRQPLFMEDLLQASPMTTTKGLPVSGQADNPAGSAPDTKIDCILQETKALGRRLEGRESNISAITAETKPICMNIVGFQNCVTDLEHCISVVVDCLNTLPERDQELIFFRSKVIDLEDRGRRDNVHFFGFSERTEGSVIKVFLKTILPACTGLTSEPPLGLQRAHRMGPLWKDSSSRPHSYHCLLSDPRAG